MTCEGVFADVQWIERKLEEPAENEQVGLKFKNIDKDEYVKLMNEVEKKMQRMIGHSDGKKGEELDKAKFQRIISEYKKFKIDSVKHLRFNVAANSAKFGKLSYISYCTFFSNCIK